MLNIIHHPSQFNFDQSWIPSPHFILSIAQPKMLFLIKILADLPAAKARVSRFKTCKVTAHLPQSLNLPPFLQCFVNSACVALPGLAPSHNAWLHFALHCNHCTVPSLALLATSHLHCLPCTAAWSWTCLQRLAAFYTFNQVQLWVAVQVCTCIYKSEIAQATGTAMKYRATHGVPISW